MSRDKQTGFHISKESVDKLFPKKDIDTLGYESPIQAFIGEMRIEHERTLESETIKAVRAIDVTVDKEELIKALQYDRNQYEKGYINGYNAKASDVAEEIFAEIDKLLAVDRHGEATLDVRALAVLKKKYTEVAERREVSENNTVRCFHPSVTESQREAERRKGVENSPADCSTPSVTDQKGEGE